MKIQIVTPYQNIASDEAEEIYAVGPKGEFGVLPGHAHYVTPLAIGRLYYKKGGKRHAFVVEGGFMEVFEEMAIVMADHVERAEDLDAAKSKQELDKIEKQLSQTLELEQYEELQKHRIKEQVRLQATTESA